jgi:uncharacterized membrane protein YbhN (UPF0104 family)
VVVGSWRKRLFVLGLSAGLLLFLRQVWVSYEGIQQQDFGVIRPPLLLAALGAGLLVYLLQMLAWAVIMRYLGVALGPRQTLQGFYLSFLPRYIPGTVWGYWSRSEWLEQAFGVPYSVSLMGSVLEALGLLLTGLFLIGVYFCTQTTGSVQLLLVLASAGLLVLTIFIVPGLAMRVNRRVRGEKSAPSRSERSPSAAWSGAILLQLTLWLAFGASVLFVAESIAVIPSFDLLSSTFAASLSWIVGFLVIVVPTGLGVRELTLSTLLSSYAGFRPWQADVVALVSRLAIVLAELAWLLVGLLLYGHSKRTGSVHRVSSTAPGEE